MQKLDFTFRGSAPNLGVEAEGAKSARFTGTMTPDEDGAWEIGVGGPGIKLWLDDKLVVDNPATTNPFGPPKTAEMPLQKGHAYSLRVEQTPSRGTPVRLVWRHIDG